MYEVLKTLHLGLVALSVAGFIVRWTAAARGAAWMQARWTRIAPHVVDTLLLASGAGMAYHWDSSAWQGWLGAKMAALVAYIVFGSLALKRSRTPAGRRLAFAAALAAAGWIVAAAITKSAWGPFAWLGS